MYRELSRRHVPLLIAAALGLTLALPATAQQDLDVVASSGKLAFREYCRSCHGDSGTGDGPVARHLSPKPADLTGIAKRNDGTFPNDRVYKAISEGRDVDGHGNSEMPVWGNAFKLVREGQTEEQVHARILNLIAYLESIQQ